MLRAIRTVAAGQPIELTATFMGAHEVPVEFRGRRGDYVREIIDVMIPAIADEQLAEWCDVFCEQGVFTPDESRDILQAGQRHGLKARIHADELALSGGSRVAAEVGARSADHLIFVDESHARMLAEQQRRRHAAAVGGVLPEARALRAGAHADRAGRGGRARHRPQSRRRLHDVDAVRDVARLLRHEHDARRSADRRHAERRGVDRSRTTRSAASRPASSSMR